jgi:hypothetical protein
MQTTMLRPLVTTPGPFTSVYFEDSHDTEDAEKQLELKLRDLRHRLSEQRAPGETLDAIEAAVRDSPRPVGRSGRALLAAGDKVVVDQHLDEPPPAPVSRVSDLPYVLPLTRYGEPGVRHVVASVDQVNTVVRAIDEYGRELDVEEVRGRDHPVRRAIADIADDVAKVADRVGAEVIVLAGEIQGRRAVHEALPKHLREITQEVTHEDVAAEVVLTIKQRRLEAVLDRFRAELGRQGGLAVEGLEAVAASLVEGNVDTLLISDPGDEMVVAGGAPTQIAVTEPELRAIGASEVHEYRADEAIPVAAIAVDADLVAVDSDLTEGFGAILRHG